MPFHIIEGDITKLKTDAIVNAANSSLLGGGGVDGAIHRAAGPKLLRECKRLGGCQTGDAKITKAYKLPSKRVIHTVGPIWRGGNQNEPELLRSCYKRSLEIAKKNRLKSIAFPLISSGIYGYPKDKALDVATSTIEDFLKDNDLDVYLVIYDQNSFQINKELQEDLSEYIEENYSSNLNTGVSYDTGMADRGPVFPRSLSSASYINKELDDRVNNRGDSFSEFLLKKIDESNMTDPECYKKANIDRRLFSKIKNKSNYNPSKETAIALALSLELPLNETNELLEKAGYTLSNNILSDVIIRYFIENQNFNIFKVNEALFYYDQKLLGA